ncbi:MAG: hypothetical protein JRI68_30810 [Deltaproteobacteria bacterium]|nr:hypothetical protein [Deltaproteobacteria bacterium]
MHALFFAGMLLSLAVVLVLLAGFFVHAWLFRRQDVDSLLFGLTTFFFAIYTGSAWLLFQRLADPSNQGLRPWIDVAVGSSIVAVAVLIHFGLRYGQVGAERRLMTGVYGAMIVFLAVLGTNHWWREVAVELPGLDVLGLRVPWLRLRVTPLALAYHIGAPLGIAAVCALLGREVLRGRRESRAAVVGAALLTVTAVNDALGLGTGWVATIPVLPLGCVALVYGVSNTLLSRYGRLSGTLEGQTDELHRRSEELAASMAERERTQEELVERERLATVGELAGVIAGEVRAPLRIVNHAVAELRRADPSRADLALLLDSIKREMAHLGELVTSLLDYARPLVLHEAPIDLQQLLERALAQAQDGTTVSCRIARDEADWPELTGDADLLGRAFANLISNVVEAIDGDGEVVLQVGRQTVDGAEWAAIEIRSTGGGAANPRDPQAGSIAVGTHDGLAGLSLPLATRIVEAHGGTVVVDHDGSGGTKASALLPLVAENEDEASASPTAPA